MDAPHLSPRLLIEKPLLPSLTVWVRSDGQEVRFQRWYDVTPDVLDGIGIRSLDFIPDGVVRLVDKDSREVHRIHIKLTDEFDALPLLLARIEKAWSFAQSAPEFWTKACDILIHSQVPNFKEVSPGFYLVCRGAWLELACFWIAFLAKVRQEEGQEGWDDLISGDRVHLQALLDSVRKAANNHAKKEALETLAEHLLKGVTGFEVLPHKNTATGEIDRIVRNHVTHPIISRFGSHILVECKHWKKTIGTDQVGSFIADIRDAGLTSGFFFCRTPMSRSAKRRIDNFYQRDGSFLIVITENDIKAVCDGANLAHMLVERLETIMFQRQ
jgi:hypothetical protein